jgi:hypothetical protein
MDITQQLLIEDIDVNFVILEEETKIFQNAIDYTISNDIIEGSAKINLKVYAFSDTAYGYQYIKWNLDSTPNVYEFKYEPKFKTNVTPTGIVQLNTTLITDLTLLHQPICKAYCVYMANEGGTLDIKKSFNLSVQYDSKGTFKIIFLNEKPTDEYYIVSANGVFRDEHHHNSILNYSFYYKTTDNFFIRSYKGSADTPVNHDTTGYTVVSVSW